MSGHWSEILRAVGACDDAIAVARKFDTLQEAWDACEEPSWLNWLLREVRSNRQVPRRIRLAYARIAFPWQKELPGGSMGGPPQLRSKKPMTWTQMASNFEPTFALGCDAIRRVFPNPPRFRNGAGE